MSFPVILVGAVMVLALIGMIACAKKQRTNPNAQPIAVGLLIVVIACGIAIMFMTNSFGGDDTASLIENETRYASAKSTILGEYLKDKCAGEKVLVIASRDYDKNDRTKRLIDALKAGLGVSDVEVDTVTVEAMKDKMPAGGEFMMPIEEMMTAKDFDKVLEAHPDCKMVISMIGLPRDAANLKVLKMSKDKRPKIALLGGDIHAMKGAIAAGVVVAAVSYKPGVKYTEDAAPKDPKAAFDQRYLLVNPENVMQLSTEYKGLFQ